MKCYGNKKLKEVISAYGISDLFHYIKNKKLYNTEFNINVAIRGIKLDGQFISLEGGKSFEGILKAELIENELYLTI